MKKIPAKIATILDKLKGEYPFHITLKRINNKYYVYKEEGKWIKEEKRTKIHSEYLGRIDDQGFFIKRKLSAKDDIENAKALILSSGGTISWDIRERGADSVQNTALNRRVTERDERILTTLSMNARAPLSLISKQIGLKETAVAYQIKKLEKRYGIRYISEIDIEKLGYMPFIVLVKFEDKMPEKEELAQILSNEPRVQFAELTKGAYDLIMYLIEETTDKAGFRIWKMRSETALRNYKSRWEVSPFTQTYGFMPLRRIFFDRILGEREHKKINNPQSEQSGILLHREFVVLRELNDNSIIEFTKIDQEYKLGRGASQYTYHRLKERGILRRATLGFEKLPVRYMACLLLEHEDMKQFVETRSQMLFEIIRYSSVNNKYTLVGDIGTPNGIILFLPIIKENLDEVLEYFRTKVKGVIPNALVGTSTIVGNLCYRRFDNDYSVQHTTLLEDLHRLEPRNKEIYE